MVPFITGNFSLATSTALKHPWAPGFDYGFPRVIGTKRNMLASILVAMSLSALHSRLMSVPQKIFLPLDTRSDRPNR